MRRSPVPLLLWVPVHRPCSAFTVASTARAPADPPTASASSPVRRTSSVSMKRSSLWSWRPARSLIALRRSSISSADAGVVRRRSASGPVRRGALRVRRRRRAAARRLTSTAAVTGACVVPVRRRRATSPQCARTSPPASWRAGGSRGTGLELRGPGPRCRGPTSPCVGLSRRCRPGTRRALRGAVPLRRRVGLDRIHAATIGTAPTARTPFSAAGPRGLVLCVFSSPGADSEDPRMTGQRRSGM